MARSSGSMERDEPAKNLGDVAAVNFVDEERVSIRRIVLGALREASQYAGRYLVGNTAVRPWLRSDALDKIFIRIALMECQELIAV